MKHLRLLMAVLIAGLVGMSVAHAQATKLVITTSAGGAYAGAAFTTQPIVEAQDATNAVDGAFSGPVTIKIKAGSDATGGVVLGTTTVNAVGGVATFTDLSINQTGNFTVEASSGALTVADSLVPVMFNLAEVWGKTLPATGTATSLGGDQQIRSFAVNHNAGSPWAGTMYIPRRNTPAPGVIFYFKATATNPSAAPGSGTLKAAGPDYANPDGIFVNPSGATSWVTVAVAEDDYVYACVGFNGNLFRFNPDGTNGTQVITGFGSDALVRQFFATGKGLTTTLWYVNGAKNVEKWVANAVDGTGAPTAFTKSTLFAVTEAASQLHQSTLNSRMDTFYYVNFGGGPTPAKYSIAGVKDAAFPLYTLSNAMGIAMDSMDRMLIEAYSHSLVAMSPVDGNNLLAGAGAQGNNGTFQPAGMPSIDFVGSYYIELQRYSDRHYFWFACAASGTSPSSYNGIVSTDIPAPSPQNVFAVDAGNGGKVTITWNLPPDPEATGVKIYRGTASGPLAAKTVVAANATGGTFTDQGLTNGQTYYYTIRTAATDPFLGTAYESANLDEIPVVPSANRVPPDPPANQAALDLKDGGRVKLTWTDPPANLDHINIYQSTTAGVLGLKIATIAKGVQQSIISGLTDGVPYYFTIKGSNGPGDESSNTAQVTAVPTDTTAPTFGGLKSLHDYGYPGFRLTWDPALDNTAPVTYNVYVGGSAATVDFAHSVGTSTLNSFDLRGLTVGQDIFIAVRATDGAGNTDANTKVVAATPTRVIVDSDINAPANSDKVNFQPDPAFPALIPTGLGALKGIASDLFEGGFAAGIFSYQTNDKKGKVSYTVPVNAPGKYDIAAFWTNTTAVNTPGYVYHITLPNGTVLPDITMDQIGVNADPAGPTGSRWNLLTTQNLTPGNLVIVGDATASSSVDTAAWNVSGAVRALLEIGPSQVPIYQASSAPTIDGNITAAEWAAYPPIYLGKAWQDVIGGNWTGPADYQSTVKVKWDSNNLYLAVKSVDDVLAFPTKSTDVPMSIWNNDGLEVYLGLDPLWAPHAAPYVLGDYQVVFSATTDNGSTSTPYVGASYSAQADVISTPPTVAFVKTAVGYNMEVAIPWAAFGAFPSAPAVNQVIGFNLHGNDNDNPAVKQQDSAFSLSGVGGSATEPSAWITAKLLASAPPTPVKGDLNGDGVFDSNDVKLALKIAAGLITATQQTMDAGDVFPAGAPDGKIDIRDATRLDRALGGKDTL